MNAVLESLNHLSVMDKLQLVADLWDDIDNTLMPSMSDALTLELDRRAAWSVADPDSDKSLQEIALSLGGKLRV